MAENKKSNWLTTEQKAPKPASKVIPKPQQRICESINTRTLSRETQAPKKPSGSK